jgi:hypothetical protein
MSDRNEVQKYNSMLWKNKVTLTNISNHLQQLNYNYS